MVALSAPHNTAQKSKVKRTQLCFLTHLLVSSGPIQNALISAVAGEGMCLAGTGEGTCLGNTPFSLVACPQALH